MPPVSAESLALIAQIATGFGLAACAGLRAFLPPLALGLAARAGLMSLPPSIGWLSGNEALVALGAACLLEIAGDKIPVLDHLLDAAGTLLRPMIGAFVGAAPVLGWLGAGTLSSGHDGLYWTFLGTGAGGGALLSFGVHALKATLRLAGTAMTGGLANPLISLMEDALSLLWVVLSVLLPLLAAVAAAGAIAGYCLMRGRWAAGGASRQAGDR